MKIKGQKYNVIRDAMRAVVEHAGGAKQVTTAYSELSENRMLWDLWNVCQRNLSYDDSHPAFAQGHWTRIVPQNPAFDMYSDGDNDTHFLTALRSVGKELGLCSPKPVNS